MDSVQVQEEKKHSRGNLCCNTSVSPPLWIGFHFFQELEKIETELTSLGKLKTETLVWQKKVFNNIFDCLNQFLDSKGFKISKIGEVQESEITPDLRLPEEQEGN